MCRSNEVSICSQSHKSIELPIADVADGYEKFWKGAWPRKRRKPDAEPHHKKFWKIERPRKQRKPVTTPKTVCAGLNPGGAIYCEACQFWLNGICQWEIHEKKNDHAESVRTGIPRW